MSSSVVMSAIPSAIIRIVTVRGWGLLLVEIVVTDRGKKRVRRRLHDVVEEPAARTLSEVRV